MSRYDIDGMQGKPVDNTWSQTRRYGGMIFAGLLVSAVVFGIPNITENLSAGEYMVIQYPSGNMEAFTTPGWHPQWFGAVHNYTIRKQFSFSAKADQGSTSDESLRMRFNDGGHAWISGVVNWEMPSDSESLIELTRLYGSSQAIEQAIIRPTLEQAAYTTGPTMSSTESSAEKRNLVIHYMQDQAEHGTYMTKMGTKEVVDPITGQKTVTQYAEIEIGSDGKPVREHKSQIELSHITLFPMSVNEIRYDGPIEEQIKKRQEAIQKVQQSKADAIASEQAAITAEQNGRAEAAKAKWDQEKINAREIALAEKDLHVAELNAKAAEQYKARQIAEGQGDAEKKRLLANANNSLDSRLEAWVKVNGFYADAIKEHNGDWVPKVMMGGTGTMGSNPAQDMISMMMVKTAKDLAVDMNMNQAK